MKLITRNQYLEKLINVIGTPDIKVITGVHRSGKSKLLEAFKNHIEQNVPDHNIIQINFNLPEFDHLLEYRHLYDYINSQYVAGKENVVLIDADVVLRCRCLAPAQKPVILGIDTFIKHKTVFVVHLVLLFSVLINRVAVAARRRNRIHKGNYSLLSSPMAVFPTIFK